MMAPMPLLADLPDPKDSYTDISDSTQQEAALPEPVKEALTFVRAKAYHRYQESVYEREAFTEAKRNGVVKVVGPVAVQGNNTIYAFHEKGFAGETWVHLVAFNGVSATAGKDSLQIYSKFADMMKGYGAEGPMVRPLTFVFQVPSLIGVYELWHNGSQTVVLTRYFHLGEDLRFHLAFCMEKSSEDWVADQKNDTETNLLERKLFAEGDFNCQSMLGWEVWTSDGRKKRQVGRVTLKPVGQGYGIDSKVALDPDYKEMLVSTMDQVDEDDFVSGGKEGFELWNQ
jgi:hypothetical protein